MQKVLLTTRFKTKCSKILWVLSKFLNILPYNQMITSRFDCFQVENLVLDTKTERIIHTTYVSEPSYSSMDRNVFYFNNRYVCLYCWFQLKAIKYKNTFKSNFLQPIWLKFLSYCLKTYCSCTSFKQTMYLPTDYQFHCSSS